MLFFFLNAFFFMSDVVNCPIPPLAVAPMEGLTGFVFRQVFCRHFTGADDWFIPFVTPTALPKFTDRQLRELAPEVNRGMHAIPQLLTRRTPDFIWSAKALADLGYDEVNLNFGCPAGTVVAKGKGSGFLREPEAMTQFLDEIFSADLPIAISVKTRLGWASEDEFDRLVDVYNQFPMKRLTIHARLKTDMYKGSVRLETVDRLYSKLTMPVGYNGDIVTPDDARAMTHRFAKLDHLMIGRALMADPALLRKLRGGPAATQAELDDFRRDLFESYTSAFGSLKNAMMRMKEYWFYQLALYDDSEKPAKAIFKAKTTEDFEAAVQNLIDTCPLREDARASWYKPL